MNERKNKKKNISKLIESKRELLRSSPKGQLQDNVLPQGLSR